MNEQQRNKRHIWVVVFMGAGVLATLFAIVACYALSAPWFFYIATIIPANLGVLVGVMNLPGD